MGFYVLLLPTFLVATVFLDVVILPVSWPMDEPFFLIRKLLAPSRKEAPHEKFDIDKED